MITQEQFSNIQFTINRVRYTRTAEENFAGNRMLGITGLTEDICKRLIVRARNSFYLDLIASGLSPQEALQTLYVNIQNSNRSPTTPTEIFNSQSNNPS